MTTNVKCQLQLSNYMIKHLLFSNACLFYCKLVDIIENVDIIG